MSRASTSISAPPRRRRCCDGSSGARRTGVARSPGSASTPLFGLVEKYGINRSQLLPRPGLTLRMLAFNLLAPAVPGQPRLRKAVNFALNRRALVSVGGPLVSRASDQYLPSILPGFRDADVYPLERPDLARRRALARGDLRGGKAVLYVDIRRPMAIAQLVKQQLAEIGLEVEVKGIPIQARPAAYFNKLATPVSRGTIAFGLWSPSYIDPYAYINALFDRRFVGRRRTSRASPPNRQADAPGGRLPQGAPATTPTQRSTSGSRATPPDGRRRRPQRADARLEAGRLHRAAAGARPHRGLPAK